LVPLLDVGGLLAGIGVIIGRGGRIAAVMVAPFKNLLENLLIDLGRMSVQRLKFKDEGLRGIADIGNGDSLFNSTISKILEHVLDQHGALSNYAICLGCQSPLCGTA
jgi:hypothetical protein